MRLLNVETLCLESFVDRDAPHYVILSHTWGRDEVTFDEMMDGTFRQKNASLKIERCTSIAAQEGYSHVWIDTCCIDRSSNTEVSEEINSMFRYYHYASKCYAYLEDVKSLDDLESARWWTRGWTLQELLAPKIVEFYSQDWSFLGTKRELAYRISVLTSIDATSLNNLDSISGVSVAKRMSWAAKRETTRIEDIAYCLLGIFGVYMALLYGEGGNAFIRLQEEIMKDSADQSLFAWTAKYAHPMERGIFAQHPREFATSSSIIPTGSPMQPYSMTNKGLQVRLGMLSRGPGRYTAILACCREGDFHDLIGLPLRMVPGTGNDVFSRDMTSDLIDIDPRKAKNGELRSIYIVKRSDLGSADLQSIWIRNIPPQSSGFILSPAYTAFSPNYRFFGRTSKEPLQYLTNRNLCLSNKYAELATISFNHGSGASFFVTFGVGHGNTSSTLLRLHSNHRDSVSLESYPQALRDLSFPGLYKSCHKSSIAVPGHGRFDVFLTWKTVMERQFLVVDVFLRYSAWHKMNYKINSMTANPVWNILFTELNPSLRALLLITLGLFPINLLKAGDINMDIFRQKLLLLIVSNVIGFIAIVLSTMARLLINYLIDYTIDWL